MTRTPSRRTFLAASTAALAGDWRRSAFALPRSSMPVASFDPGAEELTPDILRTLVAAGLDAARGAGAQYADIRLGLQRTLYSAQDLSWPLHSFLSLERTFGIRTQVNGVWAFQYGTVMTTDRIARAAVSAVATARGLSRAALATHREMLPAPVAIGEWHTPVQFDPFAISPEEHARLMGAFCEIAGRVLKTIRPVCEIQWHGETRVFGSTEGALTIQRYIQCDPRTWFSVTQGVYEDAIGIAIPGLAPASRGFECLTAPALQDAIKATVDEELRLSQLPIASAEVGRYAAVFDGLATASLAGASLAPALRLSRVLGEEVDGSGTSFLSPLGDTLDRQLFSPLLNLAADRAMPRYGATRWDDEGVVAEAFPLIEHGRVVDYFGTRLTTPALADWHVKRGKPLRAHGTAVAMTAASAPSGHASHLTMAADPNGPASLDAMVRQLGDGVLLRGAVYGSGALLDSGLASGIFRPIMLYEVKKGQVTRLLRGDPYMQFDTRKFWKQIVALGGPATAQQRGTWGLSNEFAAQPIQTISAPAMLVQSADILVPPSAALG